MSYDSFVTSDFFHLLCVRNFSIVIKMTYDSVFACDFFPLANFAHYAVNDLRFGRK